MISNFTDQSKRIAEMCITLQENPSADLARDFLIALDNPDQRIRTNLHTHSKPYSDGGLSPEGIVQRFAKNSQPYFISLTDHDSVGGVERIIESSKRTENVFVISGVEFTTTGGHFLGYGIDHKKLLYDMKTFLNKTFEEDYNQIITWLMNQKRTRRKNYYNKLVMILEKRENDPAYTGKETLRDVWKLTYLRPYMIALFYNEHSAEGNAKSLKFSGILTPEKVIKLVTEYNGVTVWAHPGLRRYVQDKTIPRKEMVQIGAQGLLERATQLKGEGLSGMEVYRRRSEDILQHLFEGKSRCSIYRNIVHQLGLIGTRGQDNHIHIGEF